MDKKSNHNQLFLVDSEELEELVRNLREVKDSLLKFTFEQDLPSLLRTNEVKKILKVNDSTLATLRQNGTIPFSKIGGTIYFLKKDILELVVQNYSGVYEK
jgi:hypothetical protein